MRPFPVADHIGRGAWFISKSPAYEFCVFHRFSGDFTVEKWPQPPVVMKKHLL